MVKPVGILTVLLLAVFISDANALTEPVAHWKLDDTGGYAEDSSVNQYTGVLEGYYGDPVFSDQALIGSGCLETFDAFSSRMNSGKFPGSANALTISLWINADYLAHSTLVSKMPWDSSGKGWSIMLRDNGEVWFRVGSTSNSNTNCRASGGYSAGNWVHIACTFSSGTARLYINGSQRDVEFGITQAVNNTDSDFNLGHFEGESSTYTFDGRIDEVRIYDSALSTTEISNLADVNYYANENQAPVVDAGHGETIWLPDNTITLNGDVTDDGKPTAMVTNAWSKISGPGSVVFVDENNLQTEASFSLAGTYSLRLTANDGERERFDDITVEVFPSESNKAPLVYAGKDQSVWLPESSMILSGELFDDGQTAGVTTVWEKVSGPGSVTFSNDTALDSQAVFSAAGEYVLGLTANDGSLAHEDTVTVTVVDPTVSMTNLVGWWKMDGNGNDSSGNGFHGTLQNGAAFSTTAKIGSGSLQATDNTGSRLNCGTGPCSTDNLTVAFWAKPSAIDYGDPVGNYAHRDPASTSGWRVLLRNNGDWWFNVGGPGGSTVIQAGVVSAVDTWIHIVCTYDEGWIRIYVDGQLKNSGNTVYAVRNPTVDLQIGHLDGISYGYTFPGLIDEVAIYDAALSAENIQDLYNTGVKEYPVIPGPYDNDYGYSPEMYETNFAYNVELQYDTDGLDPNVTKSPGQAYQHPRLFFNREDLPGMRQRLATTNTGQWQMYYMKEQVKEILTGDSATYRDIYDDLAIGDGSSYLAEYNTAWTNGRTIVEMMVNEAFRCLIEVDHDAAVKLANAAGTLAGIMQGQLDAVNPTNDWQNTIQGLVMHSFSGMLYDYIHPWLSETQRSAMRNMIADATAGKWSIGMDALPAAPAGISNWFCWVTGDLMVEALAIEGETGYHPEVYNEIVQAYRRYMKLGFFEESGASYEPLGKNALAAQNLLAISMRSDPLVACKSARNHISKYYLYAMVPWGYGWTWYDDWGGVDIGPRYTDVAILKHAFPNDEVIDFVWRNAIGENYENTSDLNGSSTGYGELTARLASVKDFDGSKTWQEALEGATQDKPLTFFCNDRGHAITRSDWSADALQLHFKVGSVPGGHTHGDRGVFVFNALGRVWGGYPRSSSEQHSRYHSVVLIDDIGQGYMHTPPAKVVDYADSSLATFTTSDAYWAYGKQLYGTGELVDPTSNDFRLIPSEEPWMDLPWKDLPHWYTSYKGDIQWADNNPVERAFRTAGLIRGEHPWTLIVDDIEKDDSTHTYKWLMRLPDDLVNSVSINGLDVTLIDPGSGKRCLVRALKVNGSASWSVNTTDKTLVLATATVAPDFKIMLYPYSTTAGDPIPSTTWNGNDLTVTIGSQTDIFGFRLDAENKTVFKLTHNGCVVMPSSGDLTGDNRVNLEDISVMANGWLECYEINDLATLFENWLD